MVTIVVICALIFFIVLGITPLLTNKEIHV